MQDGGTKSNRPRLTSLHATISQKFATCIYIIHYLGNFIDSYEQSRREGRGQGQNPPRPQAPRGLITPNAARPGGLIK